jgi:hypothetical protein
MDEASTIIDLKTHFLATQVRLLSAPLRPSAEWAENSTLQEGQRPLSERAVEEALYQG